MRLLSLLLWSLAIGAIVGSIQAVSAGDYAALKPIAYGGVVLAASASVVDLARKVTGR